MKRFNFWRNEPVQKKMEAVKCEEKTEPVNYAEDTGKIAQEDETGALCVNELMEIAKAEDLSIIISANEHGWQGKVFDNKRLPYYTVIRQHKTGRADVYYFPGGLKKENIYENLPERDACRRALMYAKTIPKEPQKHSSEEHGVLGWSLDENGVLVLSGNSAMVSALISEKRVITEEDLAFELEYGDWTLNKGDVDGRLTLPWDGLQVRKVLVKPGLTTVSRSAFSPFSYYSSGRFCYDSYENLTEIILPDTVEQLCYCAVSNCPNLEKVVVPASVRTIDKTVFDKCPKLTIYTTKGSYAEEYAKAKGIMIKIVDGLEETVVRSQKEEEHTKGDDIEVNVDQIQEKVMLSKDDDTIQNPGSDQKMNYNFASESRWGERYAELVSSNTHLRGKVILPQEVEGTPLKIIKGGFENCKEVTEVILPKTLKHIQNRAFFECTSLRSVTFNSEVSFDSGTIFQNCNQLTHIHIGPDTQNSVIAFDFKGYVPIQSITVDKANEKFSVIDGVLFSKDLRTLLFYPPAKDGREYRIPETVTVIGKSAFKYNRKLERIFLPSSLRKINAFAFSHCRCLQEISIPDTVWEIGAAAFSDCEQLQRIEFVHTKNARAISPVLLKVKNLGVNGIFRGSTKITDFYVDPKNVLLKQIDGVVFTRDLSELVFYPPFKMNAEYTIPKSVKKIRSGAFSGAVFLETVYIPASVKHIEMVAFFDCPKLSEIVFEYYFEHSCIWYAGRTEYAHKVVDKCPLVTIVANKNTEAARWAWRWGCPVKELPEVQQDDVSVPSKWTKTIDSSSYQTIGLEYERGQYHVVWVVRIHNVCNESGRSQIPDIMTMNFCEFCDVVNTKLNSIYLDPLSKESITARESFESIQNLMKQHTK